MQFPLYFTEQDGFRFGQVRVKIFRAYPDNGKRGVAPLPVARICSSYSPRYPWIIEVPEALPSIVAPSWGLNTCQALSCEASMTGGGVHPQMQISPSSASYLPVMVASRCPFQPITPSDWQRLHQTFAPIKVIGMP